MAARNATGRMLPAHEARQQRRVLDAARQGWADGVAGRPYPTRYETETHAWQRNYETARLAGLEARLAGRETRWSPSVALPQHVARACGAVAASLVAQPVEEAA